MKFKQLLKHLHEKWVEYDFNYGEDKKEGRSILRKIRKEFGMEEILPNGFLRAAKYSYLREGDCWLCRGWRLHDDPAGLSGDGLCR